MVTRGVWLLAVAVGVPGVVLAASGTTGAGALLVAAAVAVALMMWSLSRLRPVEYLLEDGGFAVRRRNAPTKHFAGTTTKARRGHLGLRVAGDGGGYGYLGRYRAEGRTVRAFVTNREDVVLLDVGGVPLAISPHDPDVFLAEVERAA
jgi:Bacterial PH domain